MIRSRIAALLIPMLPLVGKHSVVATEPLSFAVETARSLAPTVSDRGCAALFELIAEHRPDTILHIGVFGGQALWVSALAQRSVGQGTTIGIDSWQTQEYLEGLEPRDPHFKWLQSVNFRSLQLNLNMRIQSSEMESCTLVASPVAQERANWADESVDLLFLDGNYSSKGALRNAMQWFGTVKRGGLIALAKANWPSRRAARVFLLEKASPIRKIEDGDDLIFLLK
jgi:hypothetical protein